MIKFTEIFSKPKQYAPKIERVVETHGVREVFLNPNYIITARENTVLREKSQRKELIEGLNKDVLFTEISISRPGTTAQLLSIVGGPEYVLEKIKESKG